jgi:cell wall-associated NlpC family hydrolase
VRSGIPAVAAACGLVMAPVVVVVIFAGGGLPAATAGPGGTGAGLRTGSVPAQYAALVIHAGSMCAAAPPSIIASQIEQESAWNPNAVSGKGAQGISQFMPSTWPSWSLPGQSPFDPSAAIPAQGRLDCALAQDMTAARQAGRLPASLTATQLMLAAYNAGPRAVLGAGGTPNNGQTPGYVTRIIAGAARYADTTGASLPTGSGLPPRIVAAAMSQVGVPYAWDGGTFTGPSRGLCVPGAAANDCNVVGFDCSGLVLFAAYQASDGRLRLSHLVQDEIDAATLILRSALEPGDLIAFTDPGLPLRQSHHIGIYLGDNQMVDAPESGALVRVDDLTTSYYRSQQWQTARLS